MKTSTVRATQQSYSMSSRTWNNSTLMVGGRFGGNFMCIMGGWYETSHTRHVKDPKVQKFQAVFCNSNFLNHSVFCVVHATASYGIWLTITLHESQFVSLVLQSSISPTSLPPLLVHAHTEKSRSEELRLLVVESEGNVEILTVEVAALLDKIASLEEECQDRCRMANEWYEALKVSTSKLIRLIFYNQLGKPSQCLLRHTYMY